MCASARALAACKYKDKYFYGLSVKYLLKKIFWFTFAPQNPQNMNIGTKIAIIGGAVLLYLFKNKSTTLEEELNKLRELVNSGDQSIMDYVEDKTKKGDELIVDSIAIEPYLDFGELAGEKWSVRMIWKLTNNSKYTYVITGIKSVVTLLGYTCKYWMPGNDKNFVTLRPGQTVEIRSEKDIIKLYDDKSVRDTIIATYINTTDYKEGLDAATYLRVQSIYGESTIASYGNIAGMVRKLNGSKTVYFNNKEGRNMVGEDL